MTDVNLKEKELALLLRATRFAAVKHRGQRRKDKVTPYINHAIEVAETLTTIGGIVDIDIIVAGLLHDTIEDTDATADELEQHFGAAIRSIVEEVSDDKSLPKAVRKQRQIDEAPHKSDAAKCVKLADKIANLNDIIGNPPVDWSPERRSAYAAWAAQVVSGLRGVNPTLETHFDELRARFQAMDEAADC